VYKKASNDPGSAARALCESAGTGVLGPAVREWVWSTAYPQIDCHSFLLRFSLVFVWLLCVWESDTKLLLTRQVVGFIPLFRNLAVDNAMNGHFSYF
jgi:hypothetical protein